MKNKESIDSLMSVLKSYDSHYFSIDWIMKLLGLERNEVRKYKINKLFENE
jgi:hypothetical protein